MQALFLRLTAPGRPRGHGPNSRYTVCVPVTVPYALALELAEEAR